MNWGGILLGAVSFAVIGAFHPLVIWAEYQFGKGCWPVFLCAGLLLAVVSLLTENVYGVAVLGILAFSCFWSIRSCLNRSNGSGRAGFPKRKRGKNNEFTQ